MKLLVFRWLCWPSTVLGLLVLTVACHSKSTPNKQDAGIDDALVTPNQSPEAPTHNSADTTASSNDNTVDGSTETDGPTDPDASNPCTPDPCHNGGVCQPTQMDADNFLCTCAPGYAGFLCETEINECEDNPCLNNGVCVDLIGTFACTCPRDFLGPTCNTEFPVATDGLLPLAPLTRRADRAQEGVWRPVMQPNDVAMFASETPNDDHKSILLADENTMHLATYASLPEATGDTLQVFVDFQEHSAVGGLLRYGVSLFRNNTLHRTQEETPLFRSRQDISSGLRIEILVTQPRKLRVTLPDETLAFEEEITLNETWNSLVLRVRNENLAVWINEERVVSETSLQGQNLGQGHGVFALVGGQGASLEMRNIRMRVNGMAVEQSEAPEQGWEWLASVVPPSQLPSNTQRSVVLSAIANKQICSKIHRDRDAFIAIDAVRFAVAGLPTYDNTEDTNPNTAEPVYWDDLTEVLHHIEELILVAVEAYESFGHTFPEVSSIMGQSISANYFQQRFVCALTDGFKAMSFNSSALPLEGRNDAFWPSDVVSQESRLEYLLPQCPWLGPFDPATGQVQCYGDQEPSSVDFVHRMIRLAFVLDTLVSKELASMDHNDPTRETYEHAWKLERISYLMRNVPLRSHETGDEIHASAYDLREAYTLWIAMHQP